MVGVGWVVLLVVVATVDADVAVGAVVDVGLTSRAEVAAVAVMAVVEEAAAAVVVVALRVAAVAAADTTTQRKEGGRRCLLRS